MLQLTQIRSSKVGSRLIVTNDKTAKLDIKQEKKDFIKCLFWLKLYDYE